MGTAHLHGVGQFSGKLVDVALHALCAAAVDSSHEGAADQNAVCTQCQCLEHIHTGADAAVHQHLHAGALEGCGDLRQHLGCGGALIQHAAAVVGHHDGSGTGLLRLQCALDGHHALDDEGALRQLHNLGQFLHALAAGGRGHVFQEGQTRCIHIHGHGKAAAGLGLCHFLADGVDVPRLDGGHTAAARSANGAGSHLHHGRVGAVTSKGSNAVFGTGAHQYIVIGHIGVGIGVVQVHCAHRARKEGIAEAFAEQLQRGVRCTAGAQGVHVYPDIGPLIIIADSGIAHALGTRAGDLVFTGHAVAHRAGLAVLTNAGTGIGKYFRISHKSILLIFPAAAAQNDPPQCSLPSI